MGTATFIQNETEFDSLLKSESLLVVDCTATWCRPCKLVAPLIHQSADDYRDCAKVFKLDLDSNNPWPNALGLEVFLLSWYLNRGN
jgi:thioredoxin 1